MNDALLLGILRKAVTGPETFRPHDHRVASLREFQLVVDTAQQAHEEGLIEASFQPPSKGKTTAGLVRSFIIADITQEGLLEIERLNAQARPSVGIDRGDWSTANIIGHAPG